MLVGALVETQVRAPIRALVGAQARALVGAQVKYDSQELGLLDRPSSLCAVPRMFCSFEPEKCKESVFGTQIL